MSKEYLSIPSDKRQREFTILAPEEEAKLKGQTIPEQDRRQLSDSEPPLISQSEQLNRDFFGDRYDTLFPSTKLGTGSESIPSPKFSEQVWQYLEKKELAAYYLPNIEFPEITKDTDIPAYIKTLPRQISEQATRP